jgi:hypothetical protein
MEDCNQLRSNDLTHLSIEVEVSVRIHAGLCYRPWSKLWYFARAIDIDGAGWVELSLSEICAFFDVASSTVYEWLRDGRAEQAFRAYSRKGDRLKLWLGSLAKVALYSGVGQDWGAVAEVPLSALREIKAHAAAATTQRLQEQSRYAARRSLKKRERQFWRLPEAKDLIKETKKSSDRPAQGEIPFYLWGGDRLIFVSRGFIPFGCSQEGVAKEINRSSRSVRRYLDHLGVESRQIVQHKSAYTLIDASCGYGNTLGKYAEQDISYELASDSWCLPEDEILLFEKNGRTSAGREGGHIVQKRRFFHAFNKTWLRRTNIYDLHYCLRTATRARKRYKSLMDKSAAIPISKSDEMLKARGGGKA